MVQCGSFPPVSAANRILEEELDNFAPSVQALIVPSATYAKPETLRSVENFLRRGGTVIADKNAFTLAVPRWSMNRPASSWEITLDGPAVLYLLVYDHGAPDIPEGWNLLPETVSWGVQKGIGWKKDRIYKKSVQGGRITIPGHNGKAENSYGIPNAVVIQAE